MNVKYKLTYKSTAAGIVVGLRLADRLDDSAPQTFRIPLVPSPAHRFSPGRILTPADPLSLPSPLLTGGQLSHKRGDALNKQEKSGAIL